jgi:hypothetical protein
MESNKQMLSRGVELLEKHGLLRKIGTISDSTDEKNPKQIGRSYAISDAAKKTFTEITEQNPTEPYVAVLAMTVVHGREEIPEADLFSMAMALGEIPSLYACFNNLRRRTPYIG